MDAVRLKPGEVLQVRKWAEVFEKSDAKKLKELTWVSMPTGFSSNGLQMLFDDFPPAEATAIYGTWCLLLKIAARASERGRLGGSQGKAYSTTALSRMMQGVPVELIETLISWAVYRSGWLEVVEVGVPRASPTTPELPVSENLGDSPDYRTGQDKTRQDNSGRPVRRPEISKERLNVLATQVLDALRAVRLAPEGRTAVVRFAVWLEQFDSATRDRMADELLGLLRSERPQKPWRYLFSSCQRRDPDPGTFAARWDAVVL